MPSKANPKRLNRSEVSLETLAEAFEGAGYVPEKGETAVRLTSLKDGGAIDCTLNGHFVQLTATLETDPAWSRESLLEASNAFNVEHLASATKLFIAMPGTTNAAGMGRFPGYATIEAYASYEHDLDLDNLIALLYSLEDAIAEALTGDGPWHLVGGMRHTTVHYRVAPGGKRVKASAARKRLPLERVSGNEIRKALEAAYFLIDESNRQGCVVRCGSTSVNCAWRYGHEPAVFMFAPIEISPHMPEVKVNEAVNGLNEALLGVTAYALPAPDGSRALAFGTVVSTDCGLNRLELASQVQRVAGAMRTLGWTSDVTE